MCGIAGVACADWQRPVDLSSLQRMTEAVRHRGPDGDGYYLAPGVGLGFRRLSIIDLKTGDQPISNEDGSVIVVCNGEIYNYLELRHQLAGRGHRFQTMSDVEVIVHLYEDHGPEALHHLRGMFGLAIWDSQRRLLLLARDRLGIKPVNYYLAPDSLYFGSESKSILAANALEPALDIQALRTLFTFGFVLGPRTLLRDIQRLEPGHYLLYRHGAASVHKYWDVSFPPEREYRSLSADRWAGLLREKLEESVQLHLRSDVPVGAWLSAGIDSSIVASLAKRLGNTPPQSFSLGFQNPEFDEITSQRTLDRYPGYELPNSRALCGDEHLRLIPRMVWHCEDLSLGGLEIPRMVLSELTTGSVKVVVTGEGSDELFGGYGWFRVNDLFRALSRVPLSLRRAALLGGLVTGRWPSASKKLLAPREMNLTRYQHFIARRNAGLLGRLLSPEFAYALETASDCDSGPVRPPDFDSWAPFAQLQYYEMKTRMPDLVMLHLDRTCMAYSLEARVPFLDHEVVEFCSTIPPSLKMRWFREKYILRRASEGIVPAEIAWRRKRGLRAPVTQWLRGRLPDFVDDLLTPECLKEKGYFNPEFVLRLQEAHRAGKGDYSDVVLGVLLVQLWDDLFIRGHTEVLGL